MTPSRRALSLLALAFSGPLVASESSGDAFVDGPLGERLDRLCTRAAATGFSGTVLVRRGERTLLMKGYGLADREAGVANGPETLYEVASLSKQFTAAAVLSLEQDGGLAVDSPLSSYLTSIPDAYRGVTIYQALTHTGGLPRGGSGRGLDLTAATRAHLASAPLFGPGQDYAYSNVGYALLAGLVNTASGESLEDYSRERLFKRAGMQSTSFCDRPVDGPVALGYSAKSSAPRSPWRDPYAPEGEFGYEYRGMGGVVTSVLDLERWVAALQTSAVLDAPARRKLFTPTRHGYACGWEAFSFKDGRRCLGHGGSVRGYTSKLWWLPDDGALIIVLANQDDFDYALLTGIYETLFSGDSNAEELQASRPMPKAEPLTDAMRGLVGEYPSDSLPGVSLRVFIEDETLRADLTVDASAEQDGEPDMAGEATRLLESVATGEVRPLAQSMHPSIPDSWPQRVQTSIWPAHEAKWGRLKRVEPIAVTPLRDRPSGWRGVWLALRHERGDRLAMVGYRPSGKLQLLMLDVAKTLGLRDAELTSGGAGVLRSTASRHTTIRSTETGQVIARAPGMEMVFKRVSESESR